MLDLLSAYEDAFASLVLLFSLLILTSNLALRYFLLACGLKYNARRAVGWTSLVTAIAMLTGPEFWPVELVIAVCFLVFGIGAWRLRRQREVAISIALIALAVPTMVSQ